MTLHLCAVKACCSDLSVQTAGPFNSTNCQSNMKNKALLSVIQLCTEHQSPCSTNHRQKRDCMNLELCESVTRGGNKPHALIDLRSLKKEIKPACVFYVTIIITQTKLI